MEAEEKPQSTLERIENVVVDTLTAAKDIIADTLTSIPIASATEFIGEKISEVKEMIVGPSVSSENPEA